MKPSRYNIRTTNPDTAETVLFNTLYGSTAVIPRDELQEIVDLLENPGLDPSDEKYKTPHDFLVAGKYLIDDTTDEIAIVRNRKACGIADKNRLNVTIMPNLDCNFSCPYCYEKHSHANRMNHEMENAVIKWLSSEMPQYKVVMLDWFGGEPTLSHRRILTIGRKAQELASEHDIQLMAHITTNGFALNQAMIEQFVEIGIFSYQITVDGPPDFHNKTRILTTGKGSFKQVHANIVNLARYDTRVKISLRVNYNQNNLHTIPQILGLFPSEIRPQLRIVYEPVFGKAELSATSNLSKEEISNSVSRYYELASSMGYDVRLGGIGVGKLVYCYAERENQYVINFNGDVFKCNVSNFESSNRVLSLGPKRRTGKKRGLELVV